MKGNGNLKNNKIRILILQYEDDLSTYFPHNVLFLVSLGSWQNNFDCDMALRHFEATDVSKTCVAGKILGHYRKFILNWKS